MKKSGISGSRCFPDQFVSELWKLRLNSDVIFTKNTFVGTYRQWLWTRVFSARTILARLVGRWREALIRAMVGGTIGALGYANRAAPFVMRQFQRPHRLQRGCNLPPTLGESQCFSNLRQAGIWSLEARRFIRVPHGSSYSAKNTKSLGCISIVYTTPGSTNICGAATIFVEVVRLP